MTILIVHYHLRAGGVTRVIQSQTTVLRALGHEVIIASAGPGEGWEASTLDLPELDYSKTGSIPVDRLIALKADLWIIHNPTLGLNRAFPALVEAAATSGTRLLLQIHDFVEDGRPENYQLVREVTRLYPVASHIHYATINRRDLAVLRAAGVPPEQSHHLPNAVDPAKIDPSGPTGSLVFYPVRGIRRKNLGELCLLAAHAPPGYSFAVALSAGAEEAPDRHDAWVRFAREEKLPLTFDVTGPDPSSFRTWLARASHLVTTSISEGFGLTFLDPAFLGKALIGRDLPEITGDFASYGTLYQRLPVPLTRVPKLETAYRRQLAAAMRAYGKELTTLEITHAWEQFSAMGDIDFGNLPEEFQRDVIRQGQLPGLASWLARALAEPVIPIDTTPWSLTTYRENLARILAAVGSPGPVTWLDPDRILHQFLNPTRFHFLRAPTPETQLPEIPSLPSRGPGFRAGALLEPRKSP